MREEQGETPYDSDVDEADDDMNDVLEDGQPGAELLFPIEDSKALEADLHAYKWQIVYANLHDCLDGASRVFSTSSRYAEIQFCRARP